MMALRFIDSFDHYVTADLTEKWATNTGGVISAGNGRRSTACYRCAASGSLSKGFDNRATWIVGFAFRCAGYYSGGNISILRLVDGTTWQVELTMSATGTLLVTRNSSVFLTSTARVPLNTYTYLEFAATIHNSAGVVTIRQDGVVVLTASGLDTQTSVNAYANAVQFGPENSTGNPVDYDDVYVCDDTGSVNNTFLGDCRIDVLTPNGEGSNLAWTVSTGTTHATLVDEAAPNDDTDYLSTSTAAARDTHALANMPAITSPTIKGIQHVISARKDDAGTRQIKSCLKSGATTQAGATAHTLATSYLYYPTIWETDPDTTAAWTTSALDALEAGMENQ